MDGLPSPTARDCVDPWRLPLFCLAAAVVLALTLQLSNGTLLDTSLRGLTLALGLALLAVVGPGGSRPWTWGEAALALGLGVGLLLQLQVLLTDYPSSALRLQGPWPFARFHERLAAAALISGALLAGPNWLRKVGVPALLGVYLLLGLWILRHAPSPHIDVLVFQVQGADELLRGQNPYAMTFPNIYGHGHWYGEGLVRDGRLLFGFPYPPLSLMFATLGRALATDPRHAQLVATALAAGLMAWTRGGRLGAGAAALYLLTPRGFFVLEQSWTEPFLVLLLSATVFCAVRFPRALPYVFGLTLAIKQHTVFLLPLALLLLPEPRQQLWGFLWRAAATALAVSLPFALPDPKAFFHSVVALHIHQPFRVDSLSYLAAWVAKGHPTPPLWIPFAAVAAALGLSLWRAPRTPAGFAAATALTYATFFAFNKQAFCNYYYFVVATLCLAVAATRLPSAPTPAR
ncbi:hypothetical protein OWM54_07450 [Myxococcus sp. MISCRS1]|uniref:hypothetical protein n=1 Tax=Myxococcus sp. MISCRS1 TaxID=2996786 RepID=UPI00226D4AEF|nr:hypothetical protein [Myxococcus sp. MISCRS1]MCY0996977.1 hypothetical protein [Myxococcus sp. MISCRS1]